MGLICEHKADRFSSYLYIFPIVLEAMCVNISTVCDLSAQVLPSLDGARVFFPRLLPIIKPRRTPANYTRRY
jgi:hypothetical protein